MHNEDGSGHFLNSKEGVTQEYYLSTIDHIISILPLIRDLCTAHPQWYADYAGAGGTFKVLHDSMRNFLLRGSPQGYLLESTKRILGVSLRNIQHVEVQLRGMGVRVVTRSRYLGEAWLAENV